MTAGMSVLNCLKASNKTLCHVVAPGDTSENIDQLLFYILIAQQQFIASITFVDWNFLRLSRKLAGLPP
jgi:hypothetical protein